jgi:hypothetical protein
MSGAGNPGPGVWRSLARLSLSLSLSPLARLPIATQHLGTGLAVRKHPLLEAFRGGWTTATTFADKCVAKTVTQRGRESERFDRRRRPAACADTARKAGDAHRSLTSKVATPALRVAMRGGGETPGSFSPLSLRLRKEGRYNCACLAALRALFSSGNDAFESRPIGFPANRAVGCGL